MPKRHVKLTNIHKIACNAIIAYAHAENLNVSRTLAHHYASRIAAGTMWLTLTDDTWFDDIDTETLDLFDCSHCVLGQVVGDYRACVLTEQTHQIQTGTPETLARQAETAGLQISYEVATALGFHLDSDHDTGRRSYTLLTAGWQGVIEHLQAKHVRHTVDA